MKPQGSLNMIFKKFFVLVLSLLLLQGCATVPPGGFQYDIPLSSNAAGDILQRCYSGKPYLNFAGNGIGSLYSYNEATKTAKVEIFVIELTQRQSSDTFWGSRLNHDIVVTPKGNGSHVELMGTASATPMSNTFKQVRQILDGGVPCNPLPSKPPVS